MTRTETRRSGFTIGYDLGTVGAWVRILIGVIASLAFLIIDLADVGAGFLAESGAWLLGILGVYTAGYVLMSRRILTRLNPWASTVIFYGPVLVLPYLDALPATFRVALSTYVIVSIVVVVFIRYGGCEVVGIPSLIVRRRHVVYCPWNTVDLVDKAIEDSPWSSQLQGRLFAAVAVVVLGVAVVAGAFLLEEAFVLVWVIAALVSVGLVAAGVAVGRALRQTG